MYYVMRVFTSSLHRKPTDSLIIILLTNTRKLATRKNVTIRTCALKGAFSVSTVSQIIVSHSLISERDNIYVKI